MLSSLFLTLSAAAPIYRICDRLNIISAFMLERLLMESDGKPRIPQQTDDNSPDIKEKKEPAAEKEKQ